MTVLRLQMRKFDKDTYKVSGGLHGVGVSCVNALSSDLHVTVQRDGKIFEQEYKRGVPQYHVREIGNSDKTGTTIHFLPDNTIFITTVYNKEILEAAPQGAFLPESAASGFLLYDRREKNDDGRNFTLKLFTAKAVLRNSWRCLNKMPAGTH